MISVGIAFPPKNRNNSPTNLGVGLTEGFVELGVNPKRIEVRNDGIDPKDVKDLDLLIVPSWISGQIFEFNLAELKSENNALKIASYTGKGPYWNGCPWVTKQTNGQLAGGRNADARTLSSLNAIDLFATVWGIDAAEKECVVGMGVHKELRCGPKQETCCVLLDFFKKDWDENVFDKAIHGLNLAVSPIKVWVLGKDTMHRAVMKTVNKNVAFQLVAENHYTNFNVMAELYSRAWCILVHNESFGFPAQEASACGTKVFVSSSADVPIFYRRFAEVWNDPQDLATKLTEFKRLYVASETHLKIRDQWRTMAEELQFTSWSKAAERILKRAFDVAS